MIRQRASQYEARQSAELMLLEGQINKLVKQKNALETQLEASEAEIVLLHAEVQNVRRVLRQRESEAAEKSERIEQLETTLEVMHHESDSLERSYADLLDRVEAEESKPPVEPTIVINVTVEDGECKRPHFAVEEHGVDKLIERG